MPPKFQRNTRAIVLGPGDRPEAAETNALFGLTGTLPRLIEADVASILGNPEQPRTVFDQGELEALATSIERVGLQQPILVREGPAKGQYVLVAGERRLRAHHILKRTTIPAIITRGRPEEVALIENVQRVDLDAVDLARGLGRLMERHAYTQAAVGALIGCTEAEISRRLSVLRLPEEILAEYRERAGDISRSLLIEIAAVEDPGRQSALWQKAKQGVSVKEIRAEKNEGKTSSRARPLSLKAAGQSLDRMADELARMSIIQRQLLPEHWDRLRVLRARIDALLEG